MVFFLAVAKSWNLETPQGQYTVFVCTDEQLGMMDIKLAQNIIHYSLPPDWTQFAFRFSAMSDYFEDRVTKNVCTKTHILYHFLTGTRPITDTEQCCPLFIGAVGRK